MSNEPEFGTVLDVLADGTCNVQGDHGAVYVAEVFASAYTPAQNDRVYVTFVDRTAIILGALNSPRPTAPTVTIQDGNPTGSRYRQITALGQDTAAGDTVPALIGVRSSPPDPPSATAAGPITPSSSGTWDEVNHWDYGDVLQGQVAEFPHPRTGLWLYPSLVDSRTAVGLTIRVHRNPGSGPGGNVALRFYLHGETVTPSGQPALYEAYDGNSGFTLSPDASNTFTLPRSWAVLLAAGTRTGVGVFSTSTADYCRLDGGVLTFTFAS